MVGTVRAFVDGGYVIDYQYPSTSAPVLIGVRWRVLASRRTGPLAPPIADGLKVSHNGRGQWSAYAQGDYLILQAETDGTALADVPIPCPRVRRGVETRYYCGRWEKYSKREGWMPA